MEGKSADPRTDVMLNCFVGQDIECGNLMKYLSIVTFPDDMPKH